ncbi:putative quinol monooxygenase [Planctomicrobium sp. SH664]|uniref:putative quinol monooxygenase n=1 Tax=Planctomicrobium sp. SH664 TaxID=3448125 RepID=UPI003F5C0444
MYALNVILTVKQEQDIPQVKELLREQARLSREEPGCLLFEVCHSQTDPRLFILIERWESKEAIDVHRTAKAYTTVYAPHVLPLVDRTAHPSEVLE